MPNLNSLILCGHLTRDPELSFSHGGLEICKGGIAVNHKYKDKEEVCFIDFVVFGKGAEWFHQSARKGDAALLSGRLSLDQWEKDGVKHSRHKMVCDRADALGRKGNAAPEPAPAAEPPAQTTQFKVDDEIPFSILFALGNAVLWWGLLS
jgi:single-strand DNA-binding protein